MEPNLSSITTFVSLPLSAPTVTISITPILPAKHVLPSAAHVHHPLLALSVIPLFTSTELPAFLPVPTLLTALSTQPQAIVYPATTVSPVAIPRLALLVS